MQRHATTPLSNSGFLQSVPYASGQHGTFVVKTTSGRGTAVPLIAAVTLSCTACPVTGSPNVFLNTPLLRKKMLASFAILVILGQQQNSAGLAGVKSFSGSSLGDAGVSPRLYTTNETLLWQVIESRAMVATHLHCCSLSRPFKPALGVSLEWCVQAGSSHVLATKDLYI